MISCIIVKLPLQHNSAKNFDDRLALNRSSGSNMTSLISFDPKSNTLIRVREHVEEDLDDGFLISDYKNGKSIYRQVSIIHKLQYFFWKFFPFTRKKCVLIFLIRYSLSAYLHFSGIKVSPSTIELIATVWILRTISSTTDHPSEIFLHVFQCNNQQIH